MNVDAELHHQAGRLARLVLATMPKPAATLAKVVLLALDDIEALQWEIERLHVTIRRLGEAVQQAQAAHETTTRELIEARAKLKG